MEAMPYLRTENESIDEIKHRLLCTKFELTSARMEANNEIRKYEETIKHLFQLLRRVCQERDEARDQIQVLLRNFQPSTPAETSLAISQVHPHRPVLHIKKPSMISTKESDSRSYDLSLASSCQSRDERSFKQLRMKADLDPLRDIVIDGASIMIDKRVWGKPLPQKGRLLRTVTEAGPLLQTLLVAPLPQWQNPPPLSSSCIPSSNRTHDNDQASDNPNAVIRTSLSLAFPGNSRSRRPSQMSSVSELGLSVNYEPVGPEPYVDVDLDIMHNNILTAKKRKLQ